MTAIRKTSLVSGEGFKVEIDPFDSNPLADDYMAVNPGNFLASWQHAGDPPKLFDGGRSDLPPFTASGIDPQHLLRLPFTARHAAAAMTDPAQVAALIEEAAVNPDLYIDHPGLQAAVTRMRDWASGRMDNPDYIEEA